MEAEAWTELQLALPAEFRERLGIRVLHRDGATIFIAAGTRELAINKVVGLGLEMALTERCLDAIIAEYRRADVPRFIVQWCPQARPADAPAWLTARGFNLLSHITKLHRRVDGTNALPLARAALDVVEIGAADAELFERVVAPSLGVRPELGLGIRSTIGHSNWHFYLAMDAARPVAGAALYTRNGRGWMGLGATLANDRGRGAQSALLARRIADARSLGCMWVTADTLVTRQPSQSRRNMERLGFVAVYDRPNFGLDL